MKAEFHIGNRNRLYEALPEGTMLLVFSGRAPRKTADEFYPFFAHRNFVYLTGLEKEGFVLMAVKADGEVHESVFIQPKDFMKERWTGVRLSPEEVLEKSGIQDIRYVNNFETDLGHILRHAHVDNIAMDLHKEEPADQDHPAMQMSEYMRKNYPGLRLINIMPIMKKLRVNKQPCEIEAMRKAVKITREGIIAMMRNSHPGMYEYQYKAEWDRALTWNGVLSPAFPSIISAGKNNFCIHYYEYMGRANDGDMILNDVAAIYDNCVNDVSRGWPANGKYTEKQRKLYMCAYNTSQYMFSIIKPGMPMKDVDLIARHYCCEELKKIGLLESYDEIGKYMWHGGAHHIGYDTHDQVDATGLIQPGWVFCVDIGIYCEEWGIGFRIEDNCLVTEDGCENLTASIPRSIEEIEALMAETDHSPIDGNEYGGETPVRPAEYVCG